MIHLSSTKAISKQNVNFNINDDIYYRILLYVYSLNRVKKSVVEKYVVKSYSPCFNLMIYKAIKEFYSTDMSKQLITYTNV